MTETDYGEELERGRRREGGLRVFGHCGSCHRETNPWDAEYVAWARSCAARLVTFVKGGTAPKVGSEVAMQFTGRPGRFIRAALAGMAALAERLHETHPRLCEAVRSGEPAEMPHDLRFLVALTTTVERPAVQGLHRGLLITVPIRRQTVCDPGTGLQVVGSITEPTPPAIIHFPPFSLVLADAVAADRYPHKDYSAWLTEPGRGQSRDVTVLWPVVRRRDSPQITSASFK